MSAQHVIIAPEHSCSIWTCAGHARRSFDNLSRRRRRYSSTRFLSDHRLLRRPSGTLRSGGCDTQRGVRLRSISKASSKEATCASTSSESHIAVPHRQHGAHDHRIAARSARPCRVWTFMVAKATGQERLRKHANELRGDEGRCGVGDLDIHPLNLLLSRSQCAAARSRQLHTSRACCSRSLLLKASLGLRLKRRRRSRVLPLS